MNPVYFASDWNESRWRHSPSGVELVLRPLHEEQARKDVYEDPLDPRRHAVRLRRSEVDVEHHHGHADAEINSRVYTLSPSHWSGAGSELPATGIHDVDDNVRDRRGLRALRTKERVV
ncbi:hypothetical protein EVAR_39019_1 [Eumeta japonica]|uniref:Uncharacterized protein n=1 Tax=Eumeta variegata TaxID=151549 RepID=A0A4C1WRU9_EUMVA|nr:hypothetical protein EVAR_39019_1 [Eumeta japonica]